MEFYILCLIALELSSLIFYFGDNNEYRFYNVLTKYIQPEIHLCINRIFTKYWDFRWAELGGINGAGMSSGIFPIFAQSYLTMNVTYGSASKLIPELEPVRQSATEGTRFWNVTATLLLRDFKLAVYFQWFVGFTRLYVFSVYRFVPCLI